MDVGQLVPGRPLPPEMLDRLERLLDDRQALARLSAGTRDHRMADDRWRLTLEGDLLLLARWGARRLLAETGSAPAEAADPTVPDRALQPAPEPASPVRPASFRWPVGSIRRVLSLMPRYGFALHVLRRAVPFAMLGLPVRAAWRPGLGAQAEPVIRPLVDALGLGDLLTVSEHGSGQEVAWHQDLGDCVLLTGSQDSFATVRAAHPRLAVIGATGRCSVVIAPAEQAARGLLDQLLARRLEPSCSNIGVAAVCDGPEPWQPIHALLPAPGFADCGVPAHPATLGELVLAAHPTVVLSAHAPELAGLQPGSAYGIDCGGYLLAFCDDHGIAAVLDGLGRDPVAGWPGDWLV